MPPRDVVEPDASDVQLARQSGNFHEAAAPRWGWRNPLRLLELRNTTGANLEQLLPMIGEHRWSFEPIESREYWLWEYVEVGISRLARQTPSCDLRSNRLIFGDTTIRTLPRQGSVQRQLIEAFNDEGWPPEIEFGASDPDQRRRAVYQLNESLSPQLMHFAECGDYVRWFPGPRPPRDAAESF